MTAIVPLPRPLVDAVTLPCEFLVVYDSLDDTTVPVRREVRHRRRLESFRR